MPTCIYCNELKEILKTENIEYQEVNIMLPENESEYDKICEITKSEQVPIVLVGNQLLVPEVSFKTIKESVELVKRFLN
jgi:glutaredoxin